MKKFLNSTLPESNQDAFNKILSWLTRPDASQCVGKHGGCSYRSPSGDNACAIGVLTPDRMARLIDRSKKDTDINTVLNSRPTAKKWFEKCDERFLTSMQTFHDTIMFSRAYTNSSRLDSLKDIAITYELKIPKDITAFFSK
jgi:hypothetical protein